MTEPNNELNEEVATTLTNNKQHIFEKKATRGCVWVGRKVGRERASEHQPTNNERAATLDRQTHTHTHTHTLTRAMKKRKLQQRPQQQQIHTYINK